MSSIKTTLDLIKTDMVFRYFRTRSFNKKMSELHNLTIPETVFNEIKENGVAVFENYYSEEHCENVCKEIDRLIEKYKEQIWKDEVNSDHRIFGAEIFSEIISRFSFDKSIHVFGEKYLETQLKLTMTLAARLDFVENNLGSGGGWHRDSVAFNEFKSIIYLSEVTDENGPFTYLLGSHTQTAVKECIRKTGAHYDQYRFSEEDIQLISKKLNLKKKTFTAKKGSLILVDTRGLHIGSPIKSGSRYALTNYFSPAFRFDKMMKHCNKVILKADKNA